MLDGCDLGEARRELLGQGAAVAVGLRVHDLPGLLADRVDDTRMAVAGARDRDARGEVEVLACRRRCAPRCPIPTRSRDPSCGTTRRSDGLPMVPASDFRCAPASLVTTTQQALAPRPTVCASPTRAPSTWRGPGFSAQLVYQLDDLSERRRAERLALREQPAARVDRSACRRAWSRPMRAASACSPGCAQAELLVGEQLAGGVGVLALHDVDVGRADARLLRTRRARRASTAA